MMTLREMQDQIKNKKITQNRTVKVALLSNIILAPYFDPVLKIAFAKSNFTVYKESVQYEEYKVHQEIFKSADLIVVLLSFAALCPDYLPPITHEQIESKFDRLCEELYTYLKHTGTCPVFWFGFEDYVNSIPYVLGNVYHSFIDKINHRLSHILDEPDVLVDTKRLIAETGIKNAFDMKTKYRWNAPYSKVFVNTIAEEIHKQYLIYKGITKKCIILDCDNVLWGGILSEDGIENIVLGSGGFGRAYQDFQRFLLTLYYHGVILAVCSKNDMSDVMQVFREHSEMILREEHIACFQINWNNKPDNIMKITQTLNIGLDSMVFVDDSDFEIQSVKLLLPEVTTIKYDRDTVYEQLSCFHLRNNVDLEKVRQRNDTYQSNEKREMLKSQCQSFEQYLNALEMEIDIHEVTPVELSRIAELTQRTNKCSNGKRYTVDQLKMQIQKDNYKLYSVSVSDKFSNLGIVGAMGTEHTTLDLFSLSCRALGRNIEKKMLAYLTEKGIVDFDFTTTYKNDDLRFQLEQYMTQNK